jgi:hypothetical protein
MSRGSILDFVATKGGPDMRTTGTGKTQHIFLGKGVTEAEMLGFIRTELAEAPSWLLSSTMVGLRIISRFGTPYSALGFDMPLGALVTAKGGPEIKTRGRGKDLEFYLIAAPQQPPPSSAPSASKG